MPTAKNSSTMLTMAVNHRSILLLMKQGIALTVNNHKYSLHGTTLKDNFNKRMRTVNELTKGMHILRDSNHIT